MNDPREPQPRTRRGADSATEPTSHAPSSLSSAVNSRRGASWEDDEPFDFLLDLKDIAAESARGAAVDAAAMPTELDDAQSNVITKPPPPFLPHGAFVPPAEARPATSPLSDWEEVTPRSSSVAAAALLAAPRLNDAAPSSDELPISPPPSTEPTGGRRSAPSNAEVQQTSANGAPQPVNLTPAPQHAPNEVPPLEPSSELARLEPAQGEVRFSPSFTVENAPLTQSGVREGVLASSKASPPAWRRWGWMVLVAFLVPFAGGIVFTSWADSHRFKTTHNAASSLHRAAVQPAVVAEEHPTAARNSPVGASPAGAVQARESETLVEPVQQPLGQVNNRPAMPEDGKATFRAAKSRSKSADGAQQARPPSDPQLTQVAKEGSPSYRVKIPDEQNSLGVRNGAHNVPVNE